MFCSDKTIGDNHKNFAKSFYIYAKVSCPRRSLESTKLYSYLCANGLKPVTKPQEAELIFIYSCGGFSLDEEFSILTLKKALKIKSKSAQIIVTGCLPKIDPNSLRSYDKAIRILPSDLSNIESLINSKIPYHVFPTVSLVNGIHDLYHGSHLNRLRRKIGFNKEFLEVCIASFKKYLLHKPFNTLSSNRTYKLVIAEGCLGQCSYCAIKVAMPRFHSYPQDLILQKFKEGLKKGYKDFALIAGDIGCYGFDIGTNLPHLLNELFSVDGDYKLLLVDLNPRWLAEYGDELLKTLKLNNKKVSRIIIPIQSGSNHILSLMNRKYNSTNVKEYLLELRKNIPNLMIDTHLLIGFPGETESDFRESLQFVKELGFSKVEIYKYEDRPGTSSINFENKVAVSVINERAKLLKSQF